MMKIGNSTSDSAVICQERVKIHAAVSSNWMTLLTTPERVEVERALGAHDVVVEPADQGTGLGAGEELQRHALHVVVDAAAQVQDDALADAGRIPPLDQRQQGVDDRQRGDDQGEPDHQRAGLGAAPVDRVDDVAGEHRRGDPDDRGQHHRDEEDHYVAPVGLGEGHDPLGDAALESVG